MPILKSGFEVIRFSPLDHEKTTTEVLYYPPNGVSEQIAWLTMEEGFSKAKIELFTEFLDPNFIPKFNLADFLEAVEVAKAILKDFDDEETDLEDEPTA
jgi:hypothetical protein